MTDDNAVPKTADCNGPSRGELPDVLTTPDPLGGSTDKPAALPGADPTESARPEKADDFCAQPHSPCGPGTPPPPLIERKSEIGQIHDQFAQVIAERTCLTDSVSALVAFWAISTWFQDAFVIIPCLVITGPAHQATLVLVVLGDLCWNSLPLAGLKRGDLKDLDGNRTLLISEPYLNNKMAAVLGNLTNKGFRLAEQEYSMRGAGAKAVYIGEDSAIKRIQHSLYIDVTTPPFVKAPLRRRSGKETIDALRARMLNYRERNLRRVEAVESRLPGLSLETAAVAHALVSCLVDAPQLQQRLFNLLRPQDQQQLADRSDSIEALVAAAALRLSHQQRNQSYVKEFAAEANLLLKARGESIQLHPAKVGHKLKKLGLFTHQLGREGNGLTLDLATRTRIHEVAAAYGVEDLAPKSENFHCPLCPQNECSKEVAEV